MSGADPLKRGSGSRSGQGTVTHKLEINKETECRRIPRFSSPGREFPPSGLVDVVETEARNLTGVHEDLYFDS